MSNQNSQRHPVIVCLKDVNPEAVEWLWSPYVPFGKISFIEGDPGVGKSTVAVQIVASLSKGIPLPGPTGRQDVPLQVGNTLFLLREDGLEDTLRPRLDRAGADSSRVDALTGWQSEHGMKSGAISLKDVSILREALRERQYSLLVIDPIQSYLGGDVDMYRANETRPIMDQLAELARECMCAIVCIRHLRKSSGNKALHGGLGSIDLCASARSILVVGEDPRQPGRRIIAHSKSNLAEKGISQSYKIEGGQFYWSGTCALSADELVAPPVSTEDRSALSEATDFLRQVLNTGHLPASEVKKLARQAGISTPTLNRAKDALGVVSHRRGAQGGQRGQGDWVWELTESGYSSEQ